ncbi:MAG: hypothetical protein OQK51_16860 [Kangiellaceae bacterium]|nr:hypothetical protein [Kangiellaceae bacterium]
MPEWSEESSKAFQKAINEQVARGTDYKLQNLPELTEEKRPS